MVLALALPLPLHQAMQRHLRCRRRRFRRRWQAPGHLRLRRRLCSSRDGLQRDQLAACCGLERPRAAMGRQKRAQRNPLKRLPGRRGRQLLEKQRVPLG